MANQITGAILMIGQTVAIPVQNGNGQPFYKRELVLDASRFDQYTGKKFENYPLLEFVGNNCNQLDQYQVGQIVTVSFVLSGRKTEKDGQVRYFTNVTGYKVELFQRQPMMAQQPMQQQIAQPQPQQPFHATAPTGVQQAQPFPPAVDENGVPIGGSDDLPF